MDFTLN